MSVVIFAHGHRDFSKGGAETAAYNLFSGYLEEGIDAYLFSRTDEQLGWAELTKLKEKEYLIKLDTFEYEMFISKSSLRTFKLVGDELEKLDPKVIHFHHFFFFGLDFILYLMARFATAKFIITLHEFLGMCANDGQMIKNNGQLCYRSTEIDCSQCTGKPIQLIGQRNLTIRAVLNKFDHIISPSKFLADWYVSWGVDFSKMKVIENGQILPNAPERMESKGVIRFSYFGQINPYKGVDVLLAAFKQLDEEERKKVTLNIYGANLEKQTQEFQDSITGLVGELKGVVNLKGSYLPNQLTDLMMQNDVLIIPSIWWENSPMVIQEAFSHGLPVVSSNIGGMKEKVSDGFNGLHFSVGDPVSLADKIRLCLEGNNRLLSELKLNVKKPKTNLEIACEHISLFSALDNKNIRISEALND